jgi:protein-tyrosine phosphatase
MEMSDIPGVTEELLQLYLDTRERGNMLELLDMMLEMDVIDETFYVTLLTTRRGIDGYRRFFRILLELEEGSAILWHCTDGKDRTGIAAMLILTALGADRQTILEDYLLTNEYNARQLAMVQAAFAKRELTEHQRRMLAFTTGGVEEVFLHNAIACLEERYGSVEAYMEQELGVGAAEREKLRRMFLE